MIVDSHCHLASPQFSAELDEIVSRAVDAGVTRIISVSTDLEDSLTNLELAERFPGVVFPTVGIHPCDVVEATAAAGWQSRLAELAAHPAVVAIGEIGTDHFHAPPDGMPEDDYHALQDEVLRTHLDLAVRLRKNVVVHTRESLDHTVPIFAPYRGKLRAQFHCFTNPWPQAAPLVADGHLISFTGVATFKNAAGVQACATAAAPGTFMIETDAPFLAPVPHRGKRNEPAFTADTARHIAGLRGSTVGELAAETSRTAAEFFGLPDA